MGGKKIAEEIKADIIRRVKAGEDRNDLAEEYGISRESVRRFTVDIWNQKRKRKSKEWQEWFRKQWANIWPGDEERNGK